MLKAVVIAEFCVTIAFCLTTITVLVLSLRTKPVGTVWKQCPPLCLVLILNGIVAAISTCFTVQWILFDFGCIKNVAENTFFLSVIVRIFMIIQHFNSCCEMGLFAQRIFYVLYPLANQKKFYVFATSILSVMSLAGCILPMYAVVVSVKASGRPVPEGCLTFNCMSSDYAASFYGVSVRLLQGILATSIETTTTGLGVVMLYLLRKLGKNHTSNLENQKGSFAQYVFFTRICYQIIPFSLDGILSMTAHISIGYYIGPYGVLGAAMAFTTQTLAYYSLLKKNKTSTVK
uniref:G_PROTEIN_RECEP_F1_2 domain-containing protein n=1 Tax=Steinernema glaseri TaxID=37863 RepID=A0A1I7YIN2_9BILA